MKQRRGGWVRSILAVGVTLVVMAWAIPGFTADPAKVHKAQALKKAGKYQEAAEVAPQKLCKAMYYWNAAAAIVGHRDENGDWAYDESVTESQKANAEELLKLADANLENYTDQDGTENEGCAGVDPKALSNLIAAVRACMAGNCK